MPASARWIAAVLGAVAVAVAAAPGAHATAPLQLGFFDDVYRSAPDERDAWLDRTFAVGAGLVRINIGWPVPSGPKRPAGFHARDPADPHYDFTRADASIVAADARGLQVLASFTGAPRWADGPDRPPHVPAGTWKPSSQALADYGAALARRYSGSFADPARPGQMLPKVKAFQLWNEPNLDTYLNPQWNGRHSAAPALYRRMLNGFYRGVKSAAPGALVVTAGTGPFGDLKPGGHRIMPARFWRELLCLALVKGRVRTAKCSDPAHFDVLAHHPYSVGAPRSAALYADDVSIPDIGKLTRPLRVAERTGRALPHKRHPLWVTETSYDSNPPDPGGVPSATHARWLAEAFYLLWRQGVSTIVWFQIRDQAPVPSYDATHQSGVFLRDGQPKAAAAAFAFPLVAEPAGSQSLTVWGRSPEAGQVTIQRRVGDDWQTVATVQAARHGTFMVRVRRGKGHVSIRAIAGGQTSPVWVVG